MNILVHKTFLSFSFPFFAILCFSTFLEVGLLHNLSRCWNHNSNCTILPFHQQLRVSISLCNSFINIACYQTFEWSELDRWDMAYQCSFNLYLHYKYELDWTSFLLWGISSVNFLFIHYAHFFLNWIVSLLIIRNILCVRTIK